MPWPKGKPRPKGAGRQKGTPNKIPASLKAAWIEAFGRTDGINGLVRWAKKNPTAFYTLLAKMLPREVDIKASVRLYESLTDDELRERLAQLRNRRTGDRNGAGPPGEVPPVPG